MGQLKIEKLYRCDNDCEQRGCPAHIATLEFNTVSTSYRFDDGRGHEMYFDSTLADTMIDMFRYYSETRADTVSV